MTKSSVAILAGGFGTRLNNVAGPIPKSMVEIDGKPLLNHLIDLCKRHDFFDIALLVHHKHKFIKDYFGDGSRFGVNITYCIEDEPRGTAGALKKSLSYMSESFLVLYGDTYIDVDLRAVWDFHGSSFADGTLVLHPNSHPYDSDLVQINEDGLISRIYPYPHLNTSLHRNLVNAALYVLNKKGLEIAIPNNIKLDLAKDAFPAMLDLGMKLKAFITPEYIKDMGTPDRLERVKREIASGIPEKLSGRNLRSCIFLDRDGTINEEVNYLRDPDQLVLIPGASAAIRKLNQSGALTVCITNQPIVARGEASFKVVDNIHSKLDYLIGLEGAYLDRIYYCPHHPESGHVGEVQELKIRCECRKPGTELIDLAVRELRVNRNTSWFVGDRTADIEAGRRAGLRTILVRTGYAGSDCKYSSKPDYVSPDLNAAAEWILNGHKHIYGQLANLLPSAISGRMALIGGPSRAGKSSVSQVLKEMLGAAGRMTHIVSLDGWLLPASERHEGDGVLNRYNMKAATTQLIEILNSKNRSWVSFPLHDRKSRDIKKSDLISIGAEDFLIVEGVPALIENELLGYADLKVYVDVIDEIRHQRLWDEYHWRGEPEKQIREKIISREIDELDIVRNSEANANFKINGY